MVPVVILACCLVCILVYGHFYNMHKGRRIYGH